MNEHIQVFPASSCCCINKSPGQCLARVFVCALAEVQGSVCFRVPASLGLSSGHQSPECQLAASRGSWASSGTVGHGE